MTVLHPASALVVAAHPDDIELTAGGTIALWVRGGARVDYVLCTSGEAGVPDAPVAEAIERREAEQRAAAALLGAREVVFLREPDGMLANTLELRRRLVREIRRLRPEVLVTGDPALWIAPPGYVNHPDHRAASAAAIEAAFPLAGLPRIFAEQLEEGLTPHRVSALWMACLDGSSHAVRIDVRATWDDKVRALACHASQSAVWSEAEVRGLAQLAAGGDGLAEAFRIVRT